MGVWGVMGYTGITSGFICRKASAAAAPPVNADLFLLFGLLFRKRSISFWLSSREISFGILILISFYVIPRLPR